MGANTITGGRILLHRPVIELLMFPIVQKYGSETTSRIGPKGLGLCLGRAALIGFAHNTILGAGEGARRAEIRELLIKRVWRAAHMYKVPGRAAHMETWGSRRECVC